VWRAHLVLYVIFNDLQARRNLSIRQAEAGGWCEFEASLVRYWDRLKSRDSGLRLCERNEAAFPPGRAIERKRLLCHRVRWHWGGGGRPHLKKPKGDSSKLSLRFEDGVSGHRDGDGDGDGDTLMSHVGRAQRPP
jgi:hypothetical protein